MAVDELVQSASKKALIVNAVFANPDLNRKELGKLPDMREVYASGIKQQILHGALSESDLIKAIDEELQRRIVEKYLPMEVEEIQVPATKDGVRAFVEKNHPEPLKEFREKTGKYSTREILINAFLLEGELSSIDYAVAASTSPQYVHNVRSSWREGKLNDKAREAIDAPLLEQLVYLFRGLGTHVSLPDSIELPSPDDEEEDEDGEGEEEEDIDTTGADVDISVRENSTEVPQPGEGIANPLVASRTATRGETVSSDESPAPVDTQSEAETEPPEINSAVVPLIEEPEPESESDTEDEPLPAQAETTNGADVVADEEEIDEDTEESEPDEVEETEEKGDDEAESEPEPRSQVIQASRFSQRAETGEDEDEDVDEEDDSGLTEEPMELLQVAGATQEPRPGSEDDSVDEDEDDEVDESDDHEDDAEDEAVEEDTDDAEETDNEARETNQIEEIEVAEPAFDPDPDSGPNLEPENRPGAVEEEAKAEVEAEEEAIDQFVANEEDEPEPEPEPEDEDEPTPGLEIETDPEFEPEDEADEEAEPEPEPEDWIEDAATDSEEEDTESDAEPNFEPRPAEGEDGAADEDDEEPEPEPEAEDEDPVTMTQSSTTADETPASTAPPSTDVIDEIERIRDEVTFYRDVSNRRNQLGDGAVSGDANADLAVADLTVERLDELLEKLDGDDSGN